MTVGQVLEKSEEELLALRNFGRKSYDELRERLDEMNLLPADRGMGGEEEMMEAPPLSDEETPISASRAAVAEPPEAEEASEAPAIEPEPVGRKTRPSRSKKAPAADAEEGAEGEEIPDWKRKLLELTEEGAE